MQYLHIYWYAEKLINAQIRDKLIWIFMTNLA